MSQELAIGVDRLLDELESIADERFSAPERHELYRELAQGAERLVRLRHAASPGAEPPGLGAEMARVLAGVQELIDPEAWPESGAAILRRLGPLTAEVAERTRVRRGPHGTMLTGDTIS